MDTQGPGTWQAVLDRLQQTAAQKPYVFRGESQCFPRIDTRLNRRLTDWQVPDLPAFLPMCQTRILQKMCQFIPEFPHNYRMPEVLHLGLVEAAHEDLRIVELLCRLQHFGGTTNLLDFTRDYLVALFFACIHDEDQDGRVIFLSYDPRAVWEPTPTDLRIQAQKSCLYWAWQGEIPEDTEDVIIVKIPHSHKSSLLQHLEQCHHISVETIYPDLHGAISWSEQESRSETVRTPSAFWRSILADTGWVPAP